MTEAGPPTQFGPYLVTRVSGAGGMGHLELALRRGVPKQELCVLKRLQVVPHDETREEREEREERLRRAAQLASRLEHMNIARTQPIEKIDGQLCIAQELIEGVTLAKLMRQLGTRPLPLPIALHIVGEVARGLGYAHAFGRLGIVHGDVRPENVMLSFSGDVKVIDFGVGRSAIGETVTSPGVVVGRRSYVPPEACDGAQGDCRGDVYALGVVLWEILTGHRVEEAAEPQLWDLRELNPEVSPLLGQIVARALAPEPEARYRSADALAAELAGFVLPEADPRGALVELLATCFNVPLQQRVVAEKLAEARRSLHPRAEGAAAAPPAADGAGRTVAATIAVRRAPSPRRSAGPWVAATLAAVLATSAVGLLRTHGRSARARALAETPETAPPLIPPPPSTMAALTALTAPLAPAQEPPAPSAPSARPGAPIEARAARQEEPPPGTGPTPEASARSTLPTPADHLLRRANDRWEHGDTAGAYRLARQALAAGAGAPAHVLLGALLINMNNYPAAEPQLQAAIALDPRNGEARRMLTLLHRTSAERLASGAPSTRPGP